jgi:hypothetical protein
MISQPLEALDATRLQYDYSDRMFVDTAISHSRHQQTP